MLITWAALASPLPVTIVPYLEKRSTEAARELGADPERVRSLVTREVESRLEVWPGEPTEDDLRRKLVDFEIVRLQRYVSSGVFPKRYFGYLDQRGDTADRERLLRKHVRCTVGVLNELRPELQISDLDIVVTFLAEGGTMMLQEPSSRMEPLHPVMDVGLDDIASGIHSEPEMVRALDLQCGTDLASMVVFTPEGKMPRKFRDRLKGPPGKEAWLMRRGTFAEAVAGTALMWVWEIDIARRKLAAANRVPLTQRDAVDRFIVSSLIYNSGLLHSERTHGAIRNFSAGRYLYERSEANAHRRERLNLLAPTPQLQEVLTKGQYRPQWTSWVAVYHVLQRYGARQALLEHTDWFDEDGAFRPHPEPVKAASAPAPTGGCTSVSPSAGSLLRSFFSRSRGGDASRPVDHE